MQYFMILHDLTNNMKQWKVQDMPSEVSVQLDNLNQLICIGLSP